MNVEHVDRLFLRLIKSFGLQSTRHAVNSSLANFAIVTLTTDVIDNNRTLKLTMALT